MAGVGARTLVVLAVIFVVAAADPRRGRPAPPLAQRRARCPVAGLALVAVSALVPAGVLLARVYPLLLEAPHVLTALALLGAAARGRRGASWRCCSATSCASACSRSAARRG